MVLLEKIFVAGAVDREISVMVIMEDELNACQKFLMETMVVGLAIFDRYEV